MGNSPSVVSDHRAFTLVEMLLVVAIIALIISILLPALRWGKETTRIAVCGTRLGQLGVGVSSYRADYRKFGLTEYSTTGSIVAMNDNMLSLTNYVASLETYVCPSTRNYLTGFDRLKARPTNTTGNFPSYESYGHFDTGKHKTPFNCKGKENLVWLIFDQDNPDINHNLSHADNHGPAGGNVLYADIHVYWIKGADWEPTRYAAQRLQ
jgi:prepilin-type N-terminal cleavage/methylation domain-containing protein